MEARKVTERELDLYRKWALKEDIKISERTICAHCVIIKQAFKWAAARKQNLIPTNPLDGYEVREPAPTPQPCFDARQVAAIIAAADGYLRPVIICMAYTGMRIGEVRDLLWTDVSLEAGEHGHIHVRRGGSGATTKTRKARAIPIHPELRTVLESLPRKAETVFTREPSSRDREGTQPINQRKVLTQVKRICKKLKFSGHERMKVHTFRHFFCSMLAKEGVPERYVRGLLGHGSSEMVDLYFTMFDPESRAAIGRIQLPSVSPNAKSAPQNGSTD